MGSDFYMNPPKSPEPKNPISLTSTFQRVARQKIAALRDDMMMDIVGVVMENDDDEHPKKCTVDVHGRVIWETP
jgi:hypothetical protein